MVGRIIKNITHWSKKLEVSLVVSKRSLMGDFTQTFENTQDAIIAVREILGGGGNAFTL